MPIVTTSACKRSHRRPALAVAVLALLMVAAVAAYFPLREGPAPSGPRGGGTPPAAPAPSSTTAVRDDGRAAGASLPAGRDGPAPREYADVMQNGGALGESALPEADEPPSLQPSSPSTNEAPKPPKHFRSPAEELLAMMLSTPPDVAMPPLPQLDPDDARLNADALSAVTNDLVIYDTDGERLERLKEDVAGAKFQLADAVAKGVSVAEALNEFRAHQNEGVEIRNETIKAINALEDDQAAIETFKKANEELVREDIAPIKPEEVGLDAAEDGETDR